LEMVFAGDFFVGFFVDVLDLETFLVFDITIMVDKSTSPHLNQNELFSRFSSFLFDALIYQ